jgi:hypothetical protein
MNLIKSAAYVTLLVFMILPAGTVCLSGQQDKQANQVEMPTEPGIYYKSPNGLIKLEQQMMSGGGLKHTGKMFVPGLTPQMVYTFHGAHAPLQIAEVRPVFYVKQFTQMENIPGQSAQDVVIVRLDVKKKNREVQASSGGNMFTFKSGFSKEKTPDITVSRLSDTLFSIVPASDLKPGEYMVTFNGTGISGYDFGIAPQQK